MSEHHTGPVELGAEMNYAEHEKTYNGFLALTKYGTMMLCVLMLAMVAGFHIRGLPWRSRCLSRSVGGRVRSAALIEPFASCCPYG